MADVLYAPFKHLTKKCLLDLIIFFFTSLLCYLKTCLSVFFTLNKKDSFIFIIKSNLQRERSSICWFPLYISQHAWPMINNWCIISKMLEKGLKFRCMCGMLEWDQGVSYGFLILNIITLLMILPRIFSVFSMCLKYWEK